MRVDTLTSIKVFRQVVESGSFVAAAEQLELSTAMVSRHVCSLRSDSASTPESQQPHAQRDRTWPGVFERCKTILDDLEQTELDWARSVRLAAAPADQLPELVRRHAWQMRCLSFGAAIRDRGRHLVRGSQVSISSRKVNDQRCA